MIVVGDVVGQGGDLRFGKGKGFGSEAVFGGERRDVGVRRPARAFAGERAVVLDHSVEGLAGQVKPVEIRVTFLEPGYDAQRLGVVVETSEGLHRRAQRLLAGMAERRMAEVVGERERLAKVFVEAEAPANRARDLRNLEAVGQPGAEKIAFVVDEDLGLVLKPPKRPAVDDPVAIPLVAGSGRAFRFRMEPPSAFVGLAGKGRKILKAGHGGKVLARPVTGNATVPPAKASRLT